jgi:hypothetical protein
MKIHEQDFDSLPVLRCFLPRLVVVDTIRFTRKERCQMRTLDYSIE